MLQNIFFIWFSAMNLLAEIGKIINNDKNYNEFHYHPVANKSLNFIEFLHDNLLRCIEITFL